MSSECSSSSSEGSTSESSSKSVSSESKSISSGDDPVESGNHPRSEGGSKSSLPLGIIRGYNSEDYHRDNLEFSRFAVNRIRENRINNTRLSAFSEEFSIPPEVRLKIPNMREQVSNPERRCVAIHSAFLAIGMCLPLQPYVRRFLREEGDRYRPHSEIKHCYKLVSHARDGDGWWHLVSWIRLADHSLITELPSSNKEWKKTWFVATTEWGRELTIGRRKQRVRSVFDFPGTWDRVHEKELTVEKRDHINTAWGTRSYYRHNDHLLDVRVIASVNIISEPSSLRLANSKRSFGKKRKLVGKSHKRKMPDKEAAPSRKGKSVASKRPRRMLPKIKSGDLTDLDSEETDFKQDSEVLPSEELELDSEDIEKKDKGIKVDDL
ncbi:hypothetical protein ACOSP7_006421 [Xanthoceras sorbifolium]